MTSIKRVLLALSLITGFAASLTIPSVALASGDKKTCKVQTNDIGTIIGHGKTGPDAFEDAATQCFDRHADLYRSRRGQDLDEDTGLTMIDVCANIKCS